MARIDTLPNFLTDVASSIKTKYGMDSENKIMPANFDTLINSYGSDATATSSDVMEKKTFYNAEGKQTGNISGIYRNAEIPKLANSLGSYSTKLQDISYVNNIAVGINQTNNTLELYNITNDGIDYDNPTIITASELSCTKLMQARFSLENLDSDTLILWVLDGPTDSSKILNRYNLSILNKTISNRIFKSINSENSRGDYISPRPGHIYDIGYAFSLYPDGWYNWKRFSAWRLSDEEQVRLYLTGDGGSHDFCQGGASSYILWSSDGEYVQYSVRANGNQSWNRTTKIIHIDTSSIKYSMVNMNAGNNKKILLGEYVIEGNKLYKVSDINTLINTMQVSLPSTYELNRYYAIKNFIFVDKISTIDIYRLQDNELELVETITTNNVIKNQGYQYGDGYTPDTMGCTFFCPGTGYFYADSNSKMYGFLEGVHGQLIGLVKNNTTYYNGYDVTARQNDVIASKVFYDSNGKKTGTMIPTYDTESLTVDEISTSQNMSDTKDIDVEDNLLILKSGNNALLIDITTDEVLYTINVGYNFDNAKFGSKLLDNTIIIWISYMDGTRTFCGRKYIINLNDNTEVIRSFSHYVGNYDGYSNGHPNIFPHPTDNTIAVCTWTYKRYREIGGNPTMYVSFVKDNGTSLSRTGITSAAATDLSAGTETWHSGYWNTTGDYFVALQTQNNIIRNYILFNVTSVGMTVKKYSNTNDRAVLIGNYYIINGNLYSVTDLSNPIKTGIISDNTNWQLGFKDFYINCNSSGYRIYKLTNDLELVQKDNGPDVWYSYTTPYNQYVLARNSSKLLQFYQNNNTGSLRALTRNNITYHRTDDSNVTAADIVKNKIGYGPNGRLVGTYPYTALTFATVEEMEAYENPVEDDYAIVYGVTYGGTFRYDNGEWTQIGESSEGQKIMDVLNQVTDTTDQYEGPGGTDTEINAVMDSILGNGGNV